MLETYQCSSSSRRNQMGQSCTWGVPQGGHNPPGRARPTWRAQVGCAHLGGLPHPFFAL